MGVWYFLKINNNKEKLLLVISIIDCFLINYTLVLYVVPSVTILTITGVNVVFEISIRIGADTFPGLAVPISIDGNRLIDILISLIASAVFLVSHKIMIISGRGFQNIWGNQIDVEHSFNDISEGSGLDTGEFFEAEFTFVPESVSFTKAVEFVPDYYGKRFSYCVAGD